jgi:hypothetical protein
MTRTRSVFAAMFTVLVAPGLVHGQTEPGAGDVGSKSYIATRFGYGVDLDVLGGFLRMEAIHRRYTDDDLRAPGGSSEIFQNMNFALVAGLRIGIR